MVEEGGDGETLTLLGGERCTRKKSLNTGSIRNASIATVTRNTASKPVSNNTFSF